MNVLSSILHDIVIVSPADFERRSGNKGIKREFLEDLIEARFVSGDFTGLRGIHDYEFDASAPIGKLTEKYLSKADQTVLEEFEKEFGKVIFLYYNFKYCQ